MSDELSELRLCYWGLIAALIFAFLWIGELSVRVGILRKDVDELLKGSPDE